MKRRILCFLFIFPFILTLVGCRSKTAIKRDIINLVEENYELIIEACETKNTEDLYDIGGIEEIDIIAGYICFYCEGQGIVPSSQYYGFYYSEDNLPVAVFNGQIICNTEDLVPEGKGYQYVDSGYNVFYTEHIRGNLYFYSASF